MGFFDWIEKVDKKYKLSEPCLAIMIEKKIEIPIEETNEVKELIDENKKLKKIIRKLLQEGITEEKIDFDRKLLE